MMYLLLYRKPAKNGSSTLVLFKFGPNDRLSAYFGWRMVPSRFIVAGSVQNIEIRFD